MGWLKRLLSHVKLQRDYKDNLTVPPHIDTSKVGSPVWEFLNTFHDTPKRFQLIKKPEEFQDEYKRITFFSFKDRETKECYDFHRVERTYHYYSYDGVSYEINDVGWMNHHELELIVYVIGKFYKDKLAQHRKLVPRKRRLEQEVIKLKHQQERERLTKIYE